MKSICWMELVPQDSSSRFDSYIDCRDDAVRLLPNYTYLCFQYIQNVRSFLSANFKGDATKDIFKIVKPFPEKPKRLGDVQRPFWVNLVLDYQWNLKEEVMHKLDILASHQSKRLSIDHTFRAVKNVVALLPTQSR